jgi:hypothetical protein
VGYVPKGREEQRIKKKEDKMQQKRWWTQKQENKMQSDEQLRKEIAAHESKERLKKYYGDKYRGKP